MATYRETHGLDRKAGLKHKYQGSEGKTAIPYQVLINKGTDRRYSPIPKSDQSDTILLTDDYDPELKKEFDYYSELHPQANMYQLQPMVFANGGLELESSLTATFAEEHIGELQDTSEGLFACLAHGMFTGYGRPEPSGYEGWAFDVSDDYPKALKPVVGGRFRYVGFLRWTDLASGSTQRDDVGIALFCQASRTPSILIRRIPPRYWGDTMGIPGREGTRPGIKEVEIMWAESTNGYWSANFESSFSRIRVMNYSEEPALQGGEGYGVAVYINYGWVVVADECDKGLIEPEPIIGRSSAGGGRLAPVRENAYGESVEFPSVTDLNREPRKIQESLTGSFQGGKNSFFKDKTKRSGNLFAVKELEKTFTTGRRFTLSVPRTKEGNSPSYAPYTFRAAGLPSGLSMNQATGSISGYLTGSEDFTLAVTIVDSQGNSDSCTVNAKMREIGLRIIAPTDASALQNGVEYSGRVQVIGGVNCSLASSTLPSGLFLGSGGEVYGTPDTNGTVNVTITATCNYQSSSPYPSTVVFTNAITFVTATALAVVNPTSLSATVGASYSNSISQTGGVSSYTYAITSLPAGLSLNASTGAITGTPTGAGNVAATATVTDSGGREATSSFTFSVGLA